MAAVAVGLGAAGTLSWLVLIGTWIAAPLGRVLSITLILSAFAVLMWLRVWRWWRVLLPGAAAVGGALFFSLGLLLLWYTATDPYAEAEAEGRFYPSDLPTDDRLPGSLATWLSQPGSGGLLLGDWLPSDRPPLQAGFVLIARGWLMPLATSSGVAEEVVDHAAGVAAQLLWIPAAAALLVALGYAARSVYAAIAFAAITPTIFANTVFTWPKMLAAAFAVAAVAVLVAGLRGADRPARALVLASGLSALGLLSHGAAAFVLPLILPLAAVLLWRIAPRRRWIAAAVAAGVAITAYTPWLLYQRFVYPPGDRLLKWHLAGVVPIDERSFVQALFDQYRATPLGELLSSRLANIDRALNPARAFADATLWQPGVLAARVEREFFDTPSALGVGVLLILALMVTWAVRRFRGGRDAVLSWSAGVVGGMIGCILLWAIAMFSPASAVVHQGSHAWIVVLLLVPFAWLMRASEKLAWCVVALQMVWVSVAYVVPVDDVVVPMRRAMLVVLVIGVVLLGFSIWLSRSERPLLGGAANTSSPGDHARCVIGAPRLDRFRSARRGRRSL